MSSDAPFWREWVSRAFSRDPFPKSRQALQSYTPKTAADIERLLAFNKKRRERNEWMSEISTIRLHEGEEFLIEPSDCVTIYRDARNEELFRWPHAMDILALTNERLVVFGDRPWNIWIQPRDHVAPTYRHYSNTHTVQLSASPTLPSGDAFPNVTLHLHSGGHLIVCHPHAEKIAEVLHKFAS